VFIELKNDKNKTVFNSQMLCITVSCSFCCCFAPTLSHTMHCSSSCYTTIRIVLQCR